VCLAVVSNIPEEHQEAEKIASHLMEQTGWKPSRIVQIAGALKYTEYDFFKRFIMRMIAKREGRSTDTSQDYEYTDWNAVKQFVEEFIESVQVPQPLN
jgi:menaquinone-dependent protoporphyrinogen oxidase